MLFLLNFLNDEEDRDFFLFFDTIDYYEEVDSMDITFRFDSRQHKKEVMSVYRKMAKREEDGVHSLIVRTGGAGFRGRVFIYPIRQSLNCKMHINNVD